MARNYKYLFSIYLNAALYPINSLFLARIFRKIPKILCDMSCYISLHISRFLLENIRIKCSVEIETSRKYCTGIGKIYVENNTYYYVAATFERE